MEELADMPVVLTCSWRRALIMTPVPGFLQTFVKRLKFECIFGER